MGARSTIQYTTGAAGTGKSYVRCPVFLMKEFLPNKLGVHYSNFPLGLVPEGHSTPPRWEGETFVDRIADAMEQRAKMDPEEVKRRVQMVPASVIESWRKGESGPWDYFEDIDLAGAHIAIDEIHVFCGRHTKAAVRQKWQEWCGEIRHRGATVEFLTQSPNKVAKEISWEAGVRVQLVSGEDRRDPLLKISMGDWYELRAGLLTGEYMCPVFAMEQRQAFGFFRRSHVEKFIIDPYYFQFYDSFSTPQKGGKAGRSEQREFQKRSRVGLLRWFTLRNAWPMTKAAAVLAVLMLLMSGQAGRIISYGVVALTHQVMGTPAEASTGSGAEPEASSAQDETDSAEPLVHKAETPPTPPVGLGTTPAPGAVVSAGAPGAPVTPPIDPAELEALRVKLAEAEAAAAEQEQLLDDLERQLGDASALVLLTRETATFRGGFTYSVGDVVDLGPYRGLTIERINYTRRLAEMDDGTILRLGAPDGVSDRQADRTGPDVRGDLPAAESVGAGPDGEAGPGNPPDDLGRGDAAAVLPPMGE